MGVVPKGPDLDSQALGCALAPSLLPHAFSFRSIFLYHHMCRQEPILGFHSLKIFISNVSKKIKFHPLHFLFTEAMNGESSGLYPPIFLFFYPGATQTEGCLPPSARRRSPRSGPTSSTRTTTRTPPHRRTLPPSWRSSPRTWTTSAWAAGETAEPWREEPRVEARGLISVGVTEVFCICKVLFVVAFEVVFEVHVDCNSVDANILVGFPP